MRWQFSLARQFLLLQLGIVLLVVGAVAAVSIAEADKAFRRDQHAKLGSVAESLAANDTVREGMRDTIWYDSLAAGAKHLRRAPLSISKCSATGASTMMAGTPAPPRRLHPG